ncbi:MAG: VanZ family protein [Bacteroidales bacterium]|nr:VanZ family protein [Bacteroidales bacterium]
MKFNTRIIWAIVFLLYVAAVAWLCFGNFSPSPDMPRELFGIPIDKCVHFLMFFPFPVLGTLAFRERSWWRTLCWMTLAANVIAALFETFQTRINPERFTDPADLNANLLGITTGLLLMAVIGLFSQKK